MEMERRSHTIRNFLKNDEIYALFILGICFVVSDLVVILAR